MYSFLGKGKVSLYFLKRERERDVREDGGSGLIFLWRGRIDHRITKTKGERGIKDFLGEEAKRRERGFFSKGLTEEEDSCDLRER